MFCILFILNDVQCVWFPPVSCLKSESQTRSSGRKPSQRWLDGRLALSNRGPCIKGELQAQRGRKPAPHRLPPQDASSHRGMRALFSLAWPLQPCCSTTDGYCRKIA